jgi:hypothetical protein
MKMKSTETVVHGHEASAHGHSAHEKPSYDDVNTPVVLLVSAISAIVTLLTIMFVQGLYYQWSNSFLRDRNAVGTHTASIATVDSQKKVLEGGDGIVPIADAMKKVVEKYGK